MVVPGPQQAVQVFAVVCGLDFLRVGGADGGHLVRIDDARLQVVGVAKVLQLVVGKGAVRQPQHVLYIPDAKHALIAQVVDGEHRADGVILGQALILDAKQCRDHAGLPVMGMNHVRHEGDQRQGIQHPPAEKGKALKLVPAHAIGVVPAKVIAVVQEVVGDAVQVQLLNAAILAAPAQVHLKVHGVEHPALIALRNAAVFGQDDAHVMPLGGKHRRQGAHHVSQAPRLHKGDALTGGKQNLHGLIASFRADGRAAKLTLSSYHMVRFLATTMG